MEWKKKLKVTTNYDEGVCYVNQLCTHLCESTIGFESAWSTDTAASALMKPFISSNTSAHSKASSGS